MVQQYQLVHKASLGDNKTKRPLDARASQHPPRWRILLTLLVFHLPPTAITLSIVLLNALNCWWRSPELGNTSELLGLLQLAAKAHELLIVLSISQILLSWLIYWLVIGNGVPLHLFTAAYHVVLGGTPLDRHLWSSLVLAVKNVKLVALGFLLLAAIIFGLVAGPASAISLIPRLHWW